MAPPSPSSARYTSSAAGALSSVQRRIGGAWQDQDAFCGGVSSVPSSSGLFSSFVPCFSLRVYQFVAFCSLKKIFLGDVGHWCFSAAPSYC
jgi:hypothetical protein